MAKSWVEGCFYEEILLKVGFKKQRERKNKSKVTQELVERKVKIFFTRNTSKKIRESLTQLKKNQVKIAMWMNMGNWAK